ncbi:MAG: ketopantoate reductase family protein [Chloroflexi bacterium]|nr:ketopantoate reductase family protein [Chloroflexota bacterium]
MITVVGTGAMATLVAARLGRLAPITMLGSWMDAVTAINRDGVHVDSGPGADSVRVAATANPVECAGASIAIVLVKAWQTAKAASQIKTFLAPDGVALTLQNGLGNFETLAAELGAERAALGVTTQGATLIGPGHAREGGRGVTHIAEHPRLGPLFDLLRAANFDIHSSPPSDLQSLVWGKLAINAAINPLTAILRVPNGELLNRPDALAVMDAAAREVAAVAAAKGIALPFPDAAARAREVARATASNRSSMFQDILRGAPTEIDAINGAVVREAQTVKMNAPVNETLWKLVRALRTTLA